MKKYLFGSDPELFIINEKTNKVVSSIGLIPGKKDHPFIDKEWKNGFGLETDNILAEFNIPPTDNIDEWLNSFKFMKDYINKFVKKFNPDYGIQCIASRMVDDDQLNSKEATEFGCDPDFNIYTGGRNPQPEGRKTNLRSAGYHVHFGYNDKSVDKAVEIIRYADMYLGIPSVVFDPDKDRRNLYGKAGSFRLQKHGCEYRVLSSFMMSSDDLIKFCFNNALKTLDAFEKKLEKIPEDVVQECINNSNVKLAKELIKRYNLV